MAPGAGMGSGAPGWAGGALRGGQGQSGLVMASGPS